MARIRVREIIRVRVRMMVRVRPNLSQCFTATSTVLQQHLRAGV